VFKSIFPALAIFAIACSSLAATPSKSTKKNHPLGAPSAKARKPRPLGVTKAPPGKGSKANTHRKGKVTRTPARSYQQAPTPDRYREIQQALASKGYLHSEPNGAWGPESSDALKRFQADQSLMPDGKINSLSLIALGLGPKRLTAKSEPATTTPTPAVPSPDPPK
jgi:hypothetical protein